MDFLLDFVWRLGRWAYLLIFVATALESSAFLGFVVPGETIVILSGFLVSLGILEMPQTIAAATIGAVIGDSIGYELGRHLGRPWLLRYGPRVGFRRRHLAQLDDLFARHGGKAVLFGRFIGFLRAMAPFIAGSSRMPYRRFLVYNVTGAVLWTAACVALGYVLGESWRVAERWVGRIGLIAGAIAALAAVVWLRWHHRRASMADQPPR
jgi:undecaprenyl-diphosphatase